MDPATIPKLSPAAVPRRTGLGGVVPWLSSIVVVGLAAAAYVRIHQPLERAHKALVAQFNARGSEEQKLRQELEELKGKQNALSSQKASLEGQLAKADADRAAAVAELQKMQEQLSTSLEAEIAAGNILIQQRGGELVVDVSDKVLFPKGEAEISEHGKTVLKQVAGTLATLSTHVIQVGGHTDSAPITSPKVLEHYPTNWELSATRATHVVRFLQDEGKVPGDRLMAAGYAEFRPTATNASTTGRQRNRRIEIVLLRKP